MLKYIKNIYGIITTISLSLVLLYVMGILRVNKFYFPILICFFVSCTIFSILKYRINNKIMQFVFELLYNWLFTIPCCFITCVTLRKIQIVLIIVMFVVLNTEKFLKKKVNKTDKTVER